MKEKDDKLVSENDLYKKSVSNVEKLISKKFDSLTQDALNGANVGIISFTDNGYLGDIESMISKSGANVSFNIEIEKSTLDKDTLDKVNEKFSKSLKNENDLINFIVDEIKSYNFTSTTLSDLQSLGVIKVKSYVKPYTDTLSVVVANNASKDAKAFSEIEKTALKSISDDKKVIAIQESGSDVELLDTYKKAEVSTINNIDSAVGRYSLVLWLENPSITGNFGSVNDDTVIIPEVE